VIREVWKKELYFRGILWFSPMGFVSSFSSQFSRD